MRKCLLLVALLIVSQLNVLQAQNLFVAPDTVCQKQPIQLISNVPDAATHYWGFCSGYLFRKPVGYAIEKPLPKNAAYDIEVAKDGDHYYAFAVSNGDNAFFRLDFGTSLSNMPIITSYGTFDNALPTNLNSVFVTRDPVDSNWYVFVCGGTTTVNSQLARIDFGKSLANVPNIANFGNLNNALNGPHGVFVAKEGDDWYGYLVNKTSNEIVRLEFGNNISLTPNMINMGASGTLLSPHDLAPIKDNGVWYFFITNSADNAIVRIRWGISLANVPGLSDYWNLGNIDNQLQTPNGITIVRDCDSLHAFVTNRGSHELIRINMVGVDGPYSAVNYNDPGNMVGPTGLSRVIRDRDNLYTLVACVDSNITRVVFEQCQNSSIGYSLTNKPPVYSYDTPNTYNVYYAINEGLPDMQVECKQIEVLRIPPIFINNDTVLCQGDTITLQALSVAALSNTWSPNYNISSTSDVQVQVWPEYSVEYRIVLPFTNGCIVDTNIAVQVHKIKADAGPDRTLTDGSSTLLGGPMTTLGPQYSYTWHPAQYIDNPVGLNPVARPPYDFTFYLTVRDNNGCVDVDTVITWVDCRDINLPNAFVPNSVARTNNAKFGLMNKGIIKLNHFRIFDRWGKMVFSTTDPSNEWDGTIDGEAAPMGVYVWDADGFCTSGERITRTGNVTLIR